MNGRLGQTPDTSGKVAHPSAVLRLAAWIIQNVDITLALTGNAFQRHSGEPQLRAVSAAQTRINKNTNLWRTELSLYSFNLVKLCPACKHTKNIMMGFGCNVLKEKRVSSLATSTCLSYFLFSFLLLQGPPGSRGLSGTRGPKGQRVRTDVQFLVLHKLVISFRFNKACRL